MAHWHIQTWQDLLNTSWKRLPEHLLFKVDEAVEAINAHAHGERAIDQSLEVYQKLMKPEDDRRYRLEHVGFITENQLKKCGELGVNISLFVDHLRFYGETFSKFLLGQERTDRWAPLSVAIQQ